MHRGYCKLARKIHDDPLWQEKPFDRARAWIDLILLARYKDGHMMVRGNKILLKRGQVGWSELALSEKWGWSRGKVSRFLAEMELDGRIAQQKSKLTTRITIINYDRYQTDNTTNDTTDNTTDNTTDGQQIVQQTDMNKKVKKEKKETTTTRFIPPSVSEVSNYMAEIGYNGNAQNFVDSNTAKGWVIGKSRTPAKDWKAMVRTWHHNDKKNNTPTPTLEIPTIAQLFRMPEHERIRIFPTLPADLQNEFGKEFRRQAAQ